MARIDVVMPQMGESITTGTITKWHKAVGDLIELDEILLEISTDKVESEIPSPIKGKISALLYKEGDTVDVGKKIAEIEDDLNAVIGTAEKTAPAAAISKENTSAPAPVSVVHQTASVSAHSNLSNEEKRFYTPLVKAMAKDAGIPLAELASLTGSGAGGRVNRSDLEKYMSSRSSGAKNAASVSMSSPAAPSTLPSSGNRERVEVIPMDNMRKAIARNMVSSKLTSPHVNSISEVDLTHLVKFRESFKDEFKRQEGFNLTYTHFVLYAIVQALKQFPLVNASIEGDNIIVKKDIHLGCAVAVPGNGLVVPNIKNADNLNLTGLARALNVLVTKARAKKLTMDELSGGTFTYTNVGSFGTLLATPVILQPQVGIYASGVIQKRVVVMKDDSIAIRSMMYGTHTYDHRLVDGQLGGEFLEAIHSHLRNMAPENLF